MGLVCHHPPLPHKPGARHNWVAQQGGLPKYIDCRARAIFWDGKVGEGSAGVSKAIEFAVGVTEDEAAGRRNATPKTRALAAAAVAQWNKMRAAARANK